MLGVLPLDKDGKCSCTPEAKDVIATTTGLAYPRDAPNIADVCIVRLLIDYSVRQDVNADGVINAADEDLVTNDPAFVGLIDAPSNCSTTLGCGPADVNRDGKVNVLDKTSVKEAVIPGTNVSCGAVQATDFSCGSTRKAPLTPAVRISLDTIQYFSDDGLMGMGIPLQNQYRRRSSAHVDQSLIDHILVEFDSLQAETNRLEVDTAALKSKLLVEQKKNDQQDQLLMLRDSKSTPQGQSLVVDIALSVAAVMVCALVVFVAQKRTRIA